jgi:hypothetical protein
VVCVSMFMPVVASQVVERLRPPLFDGIGAQLHSEMCECNVLHGELLGMLELGTCCRVTQ